jgi:glycosyltransferase involved in cell wall biosynthesis
VIRVGVDAWNLPGDHRGIGRYLREILRVWWERARERVEVTLIVPEWHTWTVRGRYLCEVENRSYRIVSRRFHGRAGLDVLWFPFNGCSWTSFSLPAVATLHDASNFVVPGYAPQTQVILRAAAERCRALITDSRFQQHELARELRIPLDRLIPIPLGVTPPRAEHAVGFDARALAPFVLYVGAGEARKGFDTLLRAMTRVKAERSDLSLVVTSRVEGWDALRDGVRIHELDYVDDDTLAALYRNCALLAFPSRYEGFGLPVIEAMSYGAPVVASNTSSVPEAGGDAASYVDPDDDVALARAILRVADDRTYSAELKRRGLAHAGEFSWERTARATLDVIEKAAR